jgi:cytidine deaminase
MTKHDSSLDNTDRQILIRSAREALANAYAPYSNFRVGAAVLTEEGNLFTGCNVENASYGLSLCAERVAIFTAVAMEGPMMRIRGLAVQGEADGRCSPCGACRQVIGEFGPAAIVLFPDGGEIAEIGMAALLPLAFSLSDK